jgi:hypothetical protein
MPDHPARRQQKNAVQIARNGYGLSVRREPGEQRRGHVKNSALPRDSFVPASKCWPCGIGS